MKTGRWSQLCHAVPVAHHWHERTSLSLSFMEEWEWKRGANIRSIGHQGAGRPPNRADRLFFHTHIQHIQQHTTRKGLETLVVVLL
jgi:hypothetical protein